MEPALQNRLLLQHATEFRFGQSWNGSDLCVRLESRGDSWLVCLDAGRGFSVLHRNDQGELGFNGPGQWFFYNSKEVRLSRDQAISMMFDLAEGRVEAKRP
jgi:hypothetical protein